MSMIYLERVQENHERAQPAVVKIWVVKRGIYMLSQKEIRSHV